MTALKQSNHPHTLDTMTVPVPHDNLQVLRAQLDEIDNRIASLLNQRFSLVSQVGHVKRRRQDLPLADQAREQEICERISAPYALHAHQICAVYDRIFDLSKQMQQSICEEGASLEDASHENPALGTTALGATTLGTTALGTTALGTTALGTTALGTTTLGTTAQHTSSQKPLQTNRRTPPYQQDGTTEATPGRNCS